MRRISAIVIASALITQTLGTANAHSAPSKYSDRAPGAPPVTLVDPFRPGATAPTARVTPGFTIPATSPMIDGPVIPPPNPSLPDGDAMLPVDTAHQPPLAAAHMQADRVVGESATTETIAGANGHLQVRNRLRPIRKREPRTGQWQTLDGTLTPTPDDRLAPRVPLVNVSIAPHSSTSDIVRVAGFSIGYPQARPVNGVNETRDVRFANALPGGKTIVESPSVYGAEEAVNLPNHAAGNSYDTNVTMPAGTTARQAPDGVEFVNSQGTVVARVDGGLAEDADGLDSTVAITLTRSNGRTALVHVEIPHGWFDDRARSFPVTIDPDFHTVTTTGFPSSGDTYVEYPVDDSSAWTSPELKVGSWNNGSNIDHTEMRFELGNDFQHGNPHIRVAKATLNLDTFHSGACSVSAATDMDVEMLGGYRGLFTTWANPSPGTGIGVHDNFVGCNEHIEPVDVTPIVQLWATNGPDHHDNNGLRLFATNEGAPYGWKKFRSAETTTGQPPTLAIDFDEYFSDYGAARSWARLAGSPEYIEVPVTNKMIFPWTSDRYELRAYTTLNGQTTLIGTSQIPSGQSIGPNQSYTFELKLNSLPPGQYPVYLTMRDKTLSGHFGIDGEFRNYGVMPRVDTLNVTNESQFGVPAYSTLDGGLVNPFLGNLYYETTDLSVPTYGPELKLSRSYNSMDTREGWFGRGWTSTFEMHAESQGNNVVVVHPDGRREVYIKQLDGSFEPPPGYNAKLVAYGTAFILTDSKKSVYAFSGPSTAQKGSLLWVKTEQGQQLSFALGNDAKVDKVTAANGRSITLQWDSARAHVIGVKSDPVGSGPDPNPIQWSYTYSGDRLQTACLTMVGRTPLCTKYDISGQLMEWVQLPSLKYAFWVDWDPAHAGRVLDRRDGDTKTWSYAYAVKGSGLTAQYVTTVTDPLMHTTTYAFNYNLQTIYVTDGAGDTTHYVYDYDSPPGNPKAHGFMVHSEVVGPDGSKMNVVDTTWDDNGNPTQEKNQLLQTTYMKYDDKGHLTDSRDPRSSSATDNRYLTHTDYDTDGHPTKRTFPKPSYATVAPTHVWTYTAGTESAEGGGTTPKGLMKTETDENGNVTSYFYNKLGDLARVVKPSGLTITYVSDGIGRRIEQHDKCANCPSAAENVTYTQYDERSLVTTVTEPAFDDTSAGGAKHQKQTVNAYYDDGTIKDSTVTGLLGGGAPRTTHHEYDNDNHETLLHDTEHGDTAKEYDDAGNVRKVTDPTGIVTQTDYDAANRPLTVSILDYQDDPGGAPNSPAPAPHVLAIASNIAYDAMGDRVSMVDASGHTVKDTYDVMGRHRGTTIINNDDAGHDFVVEMDDLNALGLPDTARSHNNELVVTKKYDELGRLYQTIEDPNGVQPRTTQMVLDGLGNVTSKKVWGPDLAVKSFVETVYDGSRHVTKQTVHNSPVDLVTTSTYDQRGNKTQMTSPRIKITTYAYDAADHLISTTAPAVPVTNVAVDGTATASASPVSPATRAAFDIFGDQVRAVDASGNVTTTAYDMTAHTKTVTYPTYQPAGGGAAITPTETWHYDGDGNVLSHTDRDNNTTDYLYTKLNQPYMQIDPLLQGHAARGQLHTIYDPMGHKIQVIDQENRPTHWRYDDAGRALRTWQDHLVNGVWSAMPPTVSVYDGAGNVVSTTTPKGETTSQLWSPLGWLRQSTAPLETGGSATTTHDHDILGHETAVYEPGHRTTRHTYDNAGRMLTEAQYVTEASLVPVTQQTYTYDEDGNRKTSQSLRGAAKNYLTTYVYDADGRLTDVTQPVDAATTIHTWYEYDAAGNLSRVTVPRTATANEVTTIHSTVWNQPDVVVEPSTPGHAALADRTYRVRYDGAGQDVGDDSPGGVSVSHVLDALGHQITASGTGPAGAVSKSFGYDLTGNMTSAGNIVMKYDERDLLQSVTGSGSNASMSYDDDGRLATRTDASGTATFGWTQLGQLKTVTDPLSGATLAYGWDQDGRLQRVTVNGAAHRDFGYDDAGRLSSDTMTSATGTVTDSTSWSYDADSNITVKTVSGAGVAGAGQNSYSYDDADRLQSWTAPGGAVTSYAWDLAGNRTQAGTASYAFNDRNQVVSDSTGKSYTWSANGWLTNDAGTAVTYDAFGRAVFAGGVSYTYDALDRVSTRNGGAFAYSGLDADPIGNGTFKVTHDPSGTPVAYADASGAHLILGDAHQDVTALTNVDGTVAASRAFDPFGNVVASNGAQAALGYQGQYSDPTTHDSKMGARWYDPSLGQFTSRDTVFGQTNNPSTLNRYTYANNNPLTRVDPTGHDGEAAAAAAAAAEYVNTTNCNRGDGYACSLVIYQDGFWQSQYGDLDQSFKDYDNHVAAPRAARARNVDQLRLSVDITNVNSTPIRPLTQPLVTPALLHVDAITVGHKIQCPSNGIRYDIINTRGSFSSHASDFTCISTDLLNEFHRFDPHCQATFDLRCVGNRAGIGAQITALDALIGFTLAETMGTSAAGIAETEKLADAEGISADEATAAIEDASQKATAEVEATQEVGITEVFRVEGPGNTRIGIDAAGDVTIKGERRCS
jgi:RHS repeat-associated protein